MSSLPPSYRILNVDNQDGLALQSIHTVERHDLPESKPNVEYVPWATVRRAVVEDGRLVNLYGTMNLWRFLADEDQQWAMKHHFLKCDSRERLRKEMPSGTFPSTELQIFSGGVAVQKKGEESIHWLPLRTIAYVRQTPNDGSLTFVCHPDASGEEFLIRVIDPGDLFTGICPWPWKRES